ncbi:hypothetical protein QJQ45_028809, partial [Haematococcus lacustris]
MCEEPDLMFNIVTNMRWLRGSENQPPSHPSQSQLQGSSQHHPALPALLHLPGLSILTRPATNPVTSPAEAQQPIIHTTEEQDEQTMPPSMPKQQQDWATARPFSTSQLAALPRDQGPGTPAPLQQGAIHFEVNTPAYNMPSASMQPLIQPQPQPQHEPSPSPNPSPHPNPHASPCPGPHSSPHPSPHHHLSPHRSPRTSPHPSPPGCPSPCPCPSCSPSPDPCPWHDQNLACLQAISPAERSRLLCEVEATLSPSTIQFLRERGAAKAAACCCPPHFPSPSPFPSPSSSPSPPPPAPPHAAAIGILVACAYFKNKEGAYKEHTVYVMTDGKEQSAAITQAAVNQVVCYLLAEHDMDMRQLYMWSDGCAGQFKGAPAMRQHWGMAQRFSMPVWWSYGATAHFKGRHDSEGGVVKQWLRGELLADRVGKCNAWGFVQHCNAYHKPAAAADPSKAHRARASVGHRWCLELSTREVELCSAPERDESGIPRFRSARWAFQVLPNNTRNAGCR